MPTHTLALVPLIIQYALIIHSICPHHIHALLATHASVCKAKVVRHIASAVVLLG